MVLHPKSSYAGQNRSVIVDGLPLLGLRQARQERYRRPGGGSTPPRPERERGQHASLVLQQIDEVVREIEAIRTARSEPLTATIMTANGPDIELPTVASGFVGRNRRADLLLIDTGKVVFRVTDDLAGLRTKAQTYAAEDTPQGNPRYANLVARIDRVDLATISDLSLGEIPDDIDDGERIWVEIWTRGGASLSAAERLEIDAGLAAFAALTPDGADVSPAYRGPERDVHVLLATGETLKQIPFLLPDIAEVHRAPTVMPIVMAEAQDEAGETADVDPPASDAAVVAIHDSGIDAQHPYVAPILLGAESVVPGEPATFDRDGHGTQMAGVAAYSDLAVDVAGGMLHADSWLVSMRLLDSAAEEGGDPERGAMWAERMTESVTAAESQAHERSVIHNLSLGAENQTVGEIDRTAWSVAADVLAWNDGRGRLLVVASGNQQPITDRATYPTANLGGPFLQQPGQAWNALTVGGYTNLDILTAQDRSAGYPDPLAPAGGLSPHSRSALGGKRPIKPDIVMEAGNTAPGGGLDNPDSQGLTILTLRSGIGGGSSLLRRTYMTSPAAAAASNALARIATAHPALRPATWRGLLVHTARWPQAALDHLPNRGDLLRTFGYGVPEVEAAMASRSNRPVMVYEGSLRPSEHGPDKKPSRRADFIEIPFPEDVLHELGDATVRLAVTLSYFIEPTDNLTRRDYAGGRLTWDMQGPTETDHSFRSRINLHVRDQGIDRGQGSYPWTIGTQRRSRGTLQHDFIEVSAADLAGPRLLAVYPTVGWWDEAQERWVNELPYSVVVSIDLGEVDIDVHALVAPVLSQIAVRI